MLAPRSAVSDDEREAGLRLLILEANFSSATTALTSGVILTALALQLGASNLMIGVLASAPFLSQLLQGPAVLLVERLRMRKRIAVISSLIGRSMLALMGLAVLMPQPIGIAAVLLAQAILCSMSAFGACAWNAWLRDLAPDERMGSVFARRTMYATAVSLAVGLAAAFALDLAPAQSQSREVAFVILYGVGCVTGLISGAVVARIPEPAMPPAPPEPLSLVELLSEPLGDRNFKRLIVFISSWQFAVNLATPFFTVFLVQQLRFDMTFVMLLSVVSQLANFVTLRNWGILSDRFAHKSVLAVAAPAYILCIVAMIGASQIEDRDAAIAYLVVLHIFMGAAVAGVTLAITNIALKLSPKGSATAYVATSALATALSAGLAPIFGGLFADFFSQRRFELVARWTSPEGTQILSPLQLSSWDFYFLLAGVIGIYALHRLTLVEEHGAIERREMIQQVLHQTRRSVRNLSTVAGLRGLTELPTALIRDARLRARFLRSKRARERRRAPVG